MPFLTYVEDKEGSRVGMKAFLPQLRPDQALTKAQVKKQQEQLSRHLTSAPKEFLLLPSILSRASLASRPLTKPLGTKAYVRAKRRWRQGHQEARKLRRKEQNEKVMTAGSPREEKTQETMVAKEREATQVRNEEELQEQERLRERVKEAMLEGKRKKERMIESKEREAQEQLSTLYDSDHQMAPPSWETVGRLRGNLALKRSGILMLEEHMRRVQDREVWIKQEIIRMSGELRAAEAEVQHCQETLRGWKSQQGLMHQEVARMVEEERSLVQSLMNHGALRPMRLTMMDEGEEEAEEGEVGRGGIHHPMKEAAVEEQRAPSRVMQMNGAQEEGAMVDERRKREKMIEAKRLEAMLSLKRRVAMDSRCKKNMETITRNPLITSTATNMTTQRGSINPKVGSARDGKEDTSPIEEKDHGAGEEVKVMDSMMIEKKEGEGLGMRGRMNSAPSKETDPSVRGQAPTPSLALVNTEAARRDLKEKIRLQREMIRLREQISQAQSRLKGRVKEEGHKWHEEQPKSRSRSPSIEYITDQDAIRQCQAQAMMRKREKGNGPFPNSSYGQLDHESKSYWRQNGGEEGGVEETDEEEEEGTESDTDDNHESEEDDEHGSEEDESEQSDQEDNEVERAKEEKDSWSPSQQPPANPKDPDFLLSCLLGPSKGGVKERIERKEEGGESEDEGVEKKGRREDGKVRPSRQDLSGRPLTRPARSSFRPYASVFGQVISGTPDGRWLKEDHTSSEDP